MDTERKLYIYISVALFLSVAIILGITTSVLVALIYAIGVTHAFLVGFTHGDSLRRGTMSDTESDTDRNFTTRAIIADHLKRQKQWEPGIYPPKPVSDTDPVRSASDRSSSSVISSEPYRTGSKSNHGDK